MQHAAQAFKHGRKGKVQTFSFVFWFSARRSSYSPIAKWGEKKEKKAKLEHHQKWMGRKLKNPTHSY